jgi:hypothetical protein
LLQAAVAAVGMKLHLAVVVGLAAVAELVAFALQQALVLVHLLQ